MWDPLSTLGALTAAWLLLGAAWRVGRVVYIYLLPWARPGDHWIRAQGAWAVVTGATDGIGRAYAHQFAKKGLNIVLISRNMNKLEKEAKEIERLHGTHTRVIQADFTGGLEIYGAIEEGLKGLDIGVLVNNVGMNHSKLPGKLLDCENPAQSLSAIVNCNMMSVVQMTRIVLPQMVSRHRGIIVNVSSMSENHPWPFLATYSATKAFVQRFSAAVGAEYISEGVTIQTVNPGPISTNLTYNIKIGWLVKGPQDWAQQAVHTLGLSSHTPGCLIHVVETFLIGLLPSWCTCNRWTVKLWALLQPIVIKRVLKDQSASLFNTKPANKVQPQGGPCEKFCTKGKERTIVKDQRTKDPDAHEGITNHDR